MKAHFSYQYFSYFIICLVVCVCLGGGAGGIMKFLMGLWKEGGGGYFQGINHKNNVFIISQT